MGCGASQPAVETGKHPAVDVPSKTQKTSCNNPLMASSLKEDSGTTSNRIVVVSDSAATESSLRGADTANMSSTPKHASLFGADVVSAPHQPQAQGSAVIMAHSLGSRTLMTSQNSDAVNSGSTSRRGQGAAQAPPANPFASPTAVPISHQGSSPGTPIAYHSIRHVNSDDAAPDGLNSSCGEHALSQQSGNTAAGADGRTLFQANSFAASKSFRRQSFYGGAGAPVTSVLVPRVRTRFSVAPHRGPSRNNSFSSQVSEGGSTSIRPSHSAVLAGSGSGFALGAASVFDAAADLRSGKVHRQEVMGKNAFQHTYIAQESAPRKTYYVLKALRVRFNVNVVPGDEEASLRNSTEAPEACLSTHDILIGLPKLTEDAVADVGGDQAELAAIHSTALIPPLDSGSVKILDPRVSLSMTLLQKMGHKNMQSVFSVMTTSDHALFLGEFYHNSNLADDDSPIDDSKLAQLAKEVVRVLHYTHTHNIPHGHLTLGNMHLKDNGASFAVSDFGLGYLFRQLTCDELYTIGYVEPALHPPERIRNARRRSECLTSAPERVESDLHRFLTDNETLEEEEFEALDLWALGCSLYRRRFGRHPFCGASVTELHDAILRQEPVFPDDCDPQLERLLRRLLHKNKARRGPFHDVMREPFIRQRVDVSRSVNSTHLAFSGGPAHLDTFFSVEVVTSFRPTPRSSGASPRAASVTFPHEQSTATPMFYYAEDQLYCTVCHAVLKVVCYQCLSCAEFRVCRVCQYQGAFTHDPEHVLECHALDSSVPADSDDAAALARSSRGHRGTIMIAASHLTEREAMILSMTGSLPMCLDVERSMQHHQHRDKPTPRDAAASVSESPIADMIVSPSAAATKFMASSGRQLMSEAAACQEETAETIIEANFQSASSELLLSNLDMEDFPLQILDPTPFAHVTVLDLANNLLSVVPDGIEYLVNLRRLLLGNNKIKELPESIGNLTDLEQLDLNHNELASLPQSLMFCDQIEILALDYNHFTEIPQLLADVEIRKVFLAANPGICHWPSRETLLSFPKGITIGLDNEPELFRRAPEVLSGGLETNICILWNKVYPDKVDDTIYLGSLRSAQSLDVYDKLNIQYVLTMGRGLDALPPPGGKHKIVIVDDLPGACIDFAFQEAVDFMEEAAESGSACLVHCFAGMSRSATAVIAYFMMKRGMRLDEAYCLTRKGRPAIYPNAGFFDQLITLDKKLYPDGRPLDMESMQRHLVP